MDRTVSDKHLTDAELFSLAAPASGEPEALPRHLSECQACSRALQEWQSALRAIGEEEVEEIERKTPQQWREAEAATMAAIRRAAPRARRNPWRWAVGIAASLAILALAMPWRQSPAPAASASRTLEASADDASGLSPADRDDDALLREAAYLARGGDDSSDLAMEESL
jgi:ElaB/YqjD/DUF883 family membrane-anchored ribosome-binding protein